jgi:hypothetical protein
MLEENNLAQTSQTLEGDNLFNELVSRGQIYTSQGSPSMLLNQNNPAALAFFFEKTGGVETEENKQMIGRLCNYLNNAANQANKNSDACQNSLMFLLKRNPILGENFERFLITNDRKKIDDKKLIKAICDSIFSEENQTPLTSDFEKLNMNPLLEAGKIFQHIDDQNLRDEKTKIKLGLGKNALVKTVNEKMKTEVELKKDLSELVIMHVIHYNPCENNPLLTDNDVKDLTSKLDQRLFSKLAKFLKPATAVGATGTSAVSQTTQSLTPS